MIGLGTLINTAAVAGGAFLGILFRKGINEKLQKTLLQACGISVIFIGIGGTLSHMLVYDGKTFSTQGTMLLIFSLVIGGFVGELIGIEARMDRLGDKLKNAIKKDDDSKFVEGFVNLSLIICIGAMAIVGSIQDGLTGDISMLTAKSTLDFVGAVIFGSIYGVGAAFSAAAVFVYQGAITLAAYFFGNFISDEIIQSLSYVGSVLIFCVGINTAFGKKIRVGNLLPSLLVPIVYILIKNLIA